MKNEDLKKLLAERDAMDRAVKPAEKLAHEIEQTGKMIRCLGPFANACPPCPEEFREFQIQLRELDGLYFLHQSGPSAEGAPKTKLSAFIYPALLAYLDELRKEFDALP